MSDNKFTKGEWFVVETDNEITVTCEDYDIFTCWTDFDDASLVAAAPDMYDMLHSIENDSNQIPPFLWDKIQSVLAKARGEHV